MPVHTPCQSYMHTQITLANQQRNTAVTRPHTTLQLQEEPAHAHRFQRLVAPKLQILPRPHPGPVEQMHNRPTNPTWRHSRLQTVHAHRAGPTHTQWPADTQKVARLMKHRTPHSLDRPAPGHTVPQKGANPCCTHTCPAHEQRHTHTLCICPSLLPAAAHGASCTRGALLLPQHLPRVVGTHPQYCVSFHGAICRPAQLSSRLAGNRVMLLPARGPGDATQLCDNQSCKPVQACPTKIYKHIASGQIDPITSGKKERHRLPQPDAVTPTGLWGCRARREPTGQRAVWAAGKWINPSR